MQKLKSKFYKTSVSTNKFSTNLFSSDKLLRFVKNMSINRQLSVLTCFIIHVGLIRIGEKTYA